MKINITSWFRKGSWAILDQALFAGSNFILSILLARWMTELEYGVLATALVGYRLSFTLYEALLTEPMLVFGPGRYKRRFQRYLGVLLYGHVGFALLFGGLLIVCWVGLSTADLAIEEQSKLAAALLALALAEPFILLRSLARSACYVRAAPKAAASGGILYVVFLLGGLYLSYYLGALSYASAFGAMALASFVSGVYLLVPVWPRLPRPSLVSLVARGHWSYGRWSLSARVLRWILNNVWYLILPIWIGIEANGALFALTVFNQAATHTYSVLSTLLVPMLVKSQDDGEDRFKRVVQGMLTLFVVIGIGYWIVVSLFDQPLVELLYGGKFVEEADLLIILGLLPLANGIGAVLSAASRAIERPDFIFWSNLAATVAALTLGLALTYTFGLTGAASSLVLTETVAAIVLVLTWLLGDRFARLPSTQRSDKTRGLKRNKETMKQEKWSMGRLLRFRLRHIIIRHPELYIPVSRWRHKPRGSTYGDKMVHIHTEPIDEHTDVVIEGPPRCGNTFAVIAFQLAQPRPVQIAHHLHAAAQVVKASRKGIPAMVLLRDPEECAVSRVASFNVPIELALRDYILFYTDVIPYRDRFVVADFQTLTSDYGVIIKALNDKFGTAFEPFEHSKENVARCFSLIDEFYQREKEQPERTVAYPTLKRQKRKEEVRSEFQSPGLAVLRNEATQLYEELASTANLLTPRG